MKTGTQHIILLLVLFSACVKPFDPVGDGSNTNYLVVEGTIIAGAETVVRLSRTHSLNDSLLNRPEKDAQVSIETESGAVFQFTSPQDGLYVSNGSQVNLSDRCRLHIGTADGKQYFSDYVEVKQTPDIDSVEWIEDNDINIYVNTHDPLNNTRYYRWEYVETYEYHAAYESYVDFRNGQLVFLEPEEYRYKCYKTDSSNSILLGNTSSFTSDIVNRALITAVPNDNSKIGVRYSILVKQYAITAEAYDYWKIIKENSEPGGDIFDPQPAQLFGNIHCMNNPDEPVIGFISASTVTEKRIFIRWGELKNRTTIDNSSLCRVTLIALEDASLFLSDGGKLPAYYVSETGPLAIANAVCVDCRRRGGVTEKPPFW